MNAPLALLAFAALALAGQEPELPEEIQDFCPLYWIFFDQGSAEVSPQAKQIIGNWAEFAKALDTPDTRYAIEAAASASEGSEAENLELSFRRGQAVVDYLTTRGFPTYRFRVRAMGRSAYMVSDPDASLEEKDAENRRGILIVETTVSNMRRVYGDAIC